MAASCFCGKTVFAEKAARIGEKRAALVFILL